MKHAVVVSALIIVLAALFVRPAAQEQQTDISALSEDEIAAMTYEQLINLPFEDLMLLADKLGVSVDELLNMKVSVSSKKALNTRESPGIISVVTGEEIANSGARDLIDVLRLVPGFEFGYDVEGIVGIGTRGIWGHEGKVLLCIDGQEMNDLLFSTLQFGSHFDVAQIKRIEIMRGPGSCVYGGFAELSVINIITKKPDDYNGLSATATGGLMPGAIGRGNVSAGMGKFYKNFNVSAAGFLSYANRTDRTFSDYSGYSYDAESGLMTTPAYNLNIGLGIKNLSARIILDKYMPNTADFWDTLVTPFDNDFVTYLGEIKYDINIGDNFALTPKFNYKRQSGWRSLDPDWYYCKTVSRYTGGLLANWDVTDNINVLGGAETYADRAVNNDTAADADVFSNGSDKISYVNVSGFGQALFKTRWVNFVVGGRGDWHNEYGSAFSPRLALTGIINRFHYKALYGRAFRAPGIENIALGLDASGDVAITPEKTDVFEIEMGYKLTSKMFLTANFFDISLSDPIVYYYDEASDADAYINYSRTGSAGLEFEYKIKDKWGYATLGYSYYGANIFDDYDLPFSHHFDKNRIDFYSVPANDNALLGFAQHKVTLNGNFTMKNLSINPSAIVLSKRYGWTEIDSVGTEFDEDLGEDVAVYEEVLTEDDPVFLLNLFLRYNKLFVDGLGVGLGVYDILNQQYDFIEPYKGWHPPYPGPSREFVAKIYYDLNF